MEQSIFNVLFLRRKEKNYDSDGRQKSTFQKTTMMFSSNQLETARKSETVLNDKDTFYIPASSIHSMDNIHIPHSYGNDKKSIVLMSLYFPIWVIKVISYQFKTMFLLIRLKYR